MYFSIHLFFVLSLALLSQALASYGDIVCTLAHYGAPVSFYGTIPSHCLVDKYFMPSGTVPDYESSSHNRLATEVFGPPAPVSEAVPIPAHKLDLVTLADLPPPTSTVVIEEHPSAPTPFSKVTATPNLSDIIPDESLYSVGRNSVCHISFLVAVSSILVYGVLHIYRLKNTIRSLRNRMRLDLIKHRRNVNILQSKIADTFRRHQLVQSALSSTRDEMRRIQAALPSDRKERARQLVEIETLRQSIQALEMEKAELVAQSAEDVQSAKALRQDIICLGIQNQTLTEKHSDTVSQYENALDCQHLRLHEVLQEQHKLLGEAHRHIVFCEHRDFEFKNLKYAASSTRRELATALASLAAANKDKDAQVDEINSLKESNAGLLAQLASLRTQLETDLSQKERGAEKVRDIEAVPSSYGELHEELERCLLVAGEVRGASKAECAALFDQAPRHVAGISEDLRQAKTPSPVAPSFESSTSFVTLTGSRLLDQRPPFESDTSSDLEFCEGSWNTTVDGKVLLRALTSPVMVRARPSPARVDPSASVLEVNTSFRVGLPLATSTPTRFQRRGRGEQGPCSGSLVKTVADIRAASRRERASDMERVNVIRERLERIRAGLSRISQPSSQS